METFNVVLSHSPKSSLSLSSTSKAGHNSHCGSLVSLNKLRDRSITGSSVMGKERGNCDFTGVCTEEESYGK